MKRLLLVTVLFLLAGCIAGCGRVIRPPGDPDSIQAAEIARSDARNAHELIQRLRPLWLVRRTDRSTRLPTVILVYQDGARLGEVDVLPEITIPMIGSIRVLDAAEAGRLPGLGSQHVERVIHITSRVVR